MAGTIPIDSTLELDRSAFNYALSSNPVADALINNLRAHTNIRVCYLAATRDGYIIADSPSASAPRRKVAMHEINGRTLGDIHHEFGFPMVVDSFTAVAWGWIKIEDAPLPAGLYTFLTMTQNKIADDRMLENPSDPDAPKT